MGRIRRLTDELANQIAAGEVVERPSSVVKELVENSLDAGATRVAIDVDQGGTALVRVSDDGEGMAREDALLCLERHATSKIRAWDDLQRLGTFGFRGEALPSIASVSRLALRTRVRDASEAIEVSVEGGGAPSVAPASGAAGTTIEVRDLFFNVPARRKFLKATATESAHVGEVVLGVALARPDVTFVLSRDGRLVREHLRAGSRADRAASALGAEKLARCLGERGPIKIEAMLAPPERARAGATGLSLLVNGRPVRDRVLARAVAQAYGSVLEGGRYPVGVVWIDLPPELVDVNVHPQKAEVRFRDGRFVFDAIARELHEGLARAFGLAPLGPNPFAAHGRGPLGVTPTLRTGEFPQPRALAETVSTRATTTTLAAPAPLPETNLFAAEAAPGLFDGPGVYARLRFVGQVHATYLVCEGDDALYVIDQHAAAERVTFDRLRRARAEQAVPMQRLLVPEVVELSASEVAAFEENASEVLRLGVEVRAVGETAVAVHGVPSLLARAEPARIARDLAAEVARASSGAARPFAGAVDLVLATMACHGSVRAGDAVSPEEAAALLTGLDQVDFAGHCPHGRPLVMRMAWSELGRRVGR
jgi:DNA mismatch repair protein MutL